MTIVKSEPCYFNLKRVRTGRRLRAGIGKNTQNTQKNNHIIYIT